MIETRKTEIRYVTSDPKKMLNMYLAKRVLKTWEESFIDEDTGETVNIERNEILFDRGTLIDQDTLAKIRFSMEADGIKEVEVSNQNRLAFENENKFLYSYLAQAQISDKKYKFLLFATGLENACLILKDYIELNYQFGFTLTMIKEFDSCVILTDNLKERKVDDASLAYLKNEITMAEYVDKMDDETEDSDEESKPNEKKFYQIETKITFTEGENEDERVQTFVVNTFNVDRAMMLITHYLKNKEDEFEKQAKEKGHEFRKREIHTAIESAKPIPVGRFIPKEFSMAYME
ncbi:RNA polymerase subunit sigma [Bacteroides sp.]|uniref:RNA polymerase subunit sigma n=1 Tax=Bacteroides sp. TaxID=29523 RepID=UPI003AB2DC2D